jgi:GDP-mannose 6-dehydrogenase
VEVIESMIGKGFEVAIYDRHVSLARLMGANKEFIEKEIPHISRLLRSSVQEVVQQSDIVVIGNRDAVFKEALQGLRPNQTVLDLVRMVEASEVAPASYEGLCW